MSGGATGEDPGCQKPSEIFPDMCCCNCAHRIDDYHHPYTTGGSIMAKRGFVCMPPGRAFSGWSEHGVCEMHVGKAKSEA